MFYDVRVYGLECGLPASWTREVMADSFKDLPEAVLTLMSNMNSRTDQMLCWILSEDSEAVNGSAEAQCEILVNALREVASGRSGQMYMPNIRLAKEFFMNTAGDVLVLFGPQGKEDAKAKKPPPALPVEAHNKTPFDADKAWEALVLLCRGQ